MKINGHKIDISDRDKVFFPDAGLTKGDLIDYYADLSEVMVPHLKRYPVSVQRFPDGIDGDGWYAKDAQDYFPDWIQRVNFPKKEGGSFNAPVVDSKGALVYLTDQAVITFHTYLSRVDDLKSPDKMIYDLDPPEGTENFEAVRFAALKLHQALNELDLQAWVQTTGSKGFHVLVPIDREWGFDQVRDFADDLSLLLVRRYPEKLTLEQRKNKRAGRIYMDTYRNSYGATSVAPYAVRVRASASVATPVTWDEVQSGVNPRDWTIKNIRNRLGQKDDPWRGMMRHAQSLATRVDQLHALVENEEPADEEENLD
jgi:bifunctional non-homologous end joining protein LigD